MLDLVCSWNLLRRLPAEMSLEWLRAVGLRWVELSMEGERWLDRVGESSLGVGLVDVSGVAGERLSPDVVRRRLSLAKPWGARVVRLVVDRSSAPAEDRGALQEIGAMAAELELVVALEFGAAGMTSRALVEVLQAVDHPSVRAGFDTGGYLSQNPGTAGDIALERVTPWLACLRLRDHTGSADQRECPPLGSGGVVDLARTLEMVRALRFAGPVVVDFDPPGRDFERLRRGVEQSMGQLRACGWCD